MVAKHIAEHSELNKLAMACKQVVLVAELILELEAGTGHYNVHPHHLL